MISSFLKLLSFWIILFGFGISSAFAQNILIFSTSHSNTGPSDVADAQGVLKIQISTFSPIVEIKVNNDLQALQGKTSAQLDYKYQLSPGENRISVLVKTEAGEQTREFVLVLAESKAEAAEKAQKPFQLIVIGNFESTDNVTNVKENKESDTKIGVTIIPRYKMDTGPDSDLLLQGIILREKYSNSDLPSPQVEFMQLGVSWNMHSSFGDWQLDAGYSDIGSTTAADATRSEIETGMFVGGSIRLNALDKKNVNLGLRYSLINATETESENHDGDGGRLSLNISWDKKLGSAKTQLFLYNEQTDAKGMYQDKGALTLGARGDYPLSKQILISGRVKTKQTTFAESDPLKGDTEATTLNTLSAKGRYQFTMVKGLYAIAAVTQKTQSSNIASKEYSALLMGLSVIVIF